MQVVVVNFLDAGQGLDALLAQVDPALCDRLAVAVAKHVGAPAPANLEELRALQLQRGDLGLRRVSHHAARGELKAAVREAIRLGMSAPGPEANLTWPHPGSAEARIRRLLTSEYSAVVAEKRRIEVQLADGTKLHEAGPLPELEPGGDEANAGDDVVHGDDPTDDDRDVELGDVLRGGTLIPRAEYEAAADELVGSGPSADVVAPPLLPPGPSESPTPVTPLPLRHDEHFELSSGASEEPAPAQE